MTGITRITLKNGLIIEQMRDEPDLYKLSDPGTYHAVAGLESIRECLESVEWLLSLRLWPEQIVSPTYKDIRYERETHITRPR